MISFDTTNLHEIDAANGLSQKDTDACSPKLQPFLDRIHARNQGFYTVIDDRRVIQDISAFAKSIKGTYTDILVLGIGGSTLGTICLQQSLTHLFDAEMKKRQTPKLHVLDNIDPSLMREILDVINLRKTLIIVVTKSGGTPETLAQYAYFRTLTDRMKLKPQKHYVFVTDPEKGLLREIATAENIRTFAVPPTVGGRFSVQTAVGLLPAALIGVNIRAFIAGMSTMRDQFISPVPKKNLPFQFASIQYLMSQKGKNIHVLMPYAQHLIRLADWYRQLLAESIGKARNNAGQIVNVGITPVNALGATDQHSQSQLYNEGPQDKFFLFLEVNNLGPKVGIPSLRPKKDELHYLNGVSFNQLLNTELRATATSYTKNNRPNITITIDAISPYTLGELFMLFEGATAFLGEFFDINAFDQPGVELSKQLTKQYLLKKK